MFGEETRREEKRRDEKRRDETRQKRKQETGNRKMNKEQRKKEKGKRKFSRLGKRVIVVLIERRVMVMMKRKRFKKWTYRTRKDDVEPTSWTPTYLRYLMISKRNLGNSVCKGWMTSLPTYLR